MSGTRDEEERLGQEIDRLLQSGLSRDRSEPGPSETEATTRVLAAAVEAAGPRAQFVAAARARLLARAADRASQPRPPFLFRLSFAMRAMAAALVLLLVLGTGTVVSAESSVPGTLLYPVKRAHENIRLQLAMQPAARAAVETDLTNQRLKELDVLVARGEKARYLDQANRIRLQVLALRQTVERLQAARAAGHPIPERQLVALRQRLQSLRDAPQALARLLDQAPPETRPRLLRIVQETQREFELLLETLRRTAD